jgi:ribosomal protein L12E/L44/L45/RPP1/RPP2
MAAALEPARKEQQAKITGKVAEKEKKEEEEDEKEEEEEENEGYSRRMELRMVSTHV